MLLCLAKVASCIQDEVFPNVEAAIDGCSETISQQQWIDPNEFTVQLYVSRAADPSKMPLGLTFLPELQIAPVTNS